MPNHLCLKTCALAASLLIYADPIGAQIPAFPGAEGFGSHATGGRGGDVYYVTNLGASGAGSFTYGVQNAPAQGRTILFAVSGHIRLPSGSGGGLTISKNKITVAGQTAPGDGICFWNNTMNIDGDHLVFRNLRWRYGKSTAGGDAIDINGSQNLIFDHCEVMFSTDENMSSFGTAPENMTFQWSVNAWGLQSHSAGGLWKMRHATCHHSLWSNNHTRNPKLIGADVFDWANNTTFGWDNGFNMAEEFTGGTGVVHRVNIRGSTFIHGASTGDAVFGGGANTDGTLKFLVHVGDSALDGGTPGTLNYTKTGYGIISTGSTYTTTATAWPQTLLGAAGGTAVGAPVTIDPMSTARKKVLSKAGAVRMEVSTTRPLRDEITQLCVDRVAALQRGIISDPLELGLSTGTAFAALTSAPAPVDTDLDGMPDAWEEALGFNPAVANNNTVFTAPQLAASFFPAGTPAGYTHLEEYLHFLAMPHGFVPKNTAEAPSFIDIDLRRYTSGFTASPVFTLAGVTGGAAASSGPGNALVRFTPTLDLSGRAGFRFTVTDSEGSTWTQQLCLLVSTTTLPRKVTWRGDSTINAWDTTSPNWLSPLGVTAFRDGDDATLDASGSGSPSIQLASVVAPSAVSVDSSAHDYVIAGAGGIGGAGGLRKSGAGTLTLRTTNTYTGPTTVVGGTLALGQAGQPNAGTPGGGLITLGNGTTLLNAWPNATSTLTINAPFQIPDGEAATLRTGRRISLGGSWSGGGRLSLVVEGSDNNILLRGAMGSFAGTLDISLTGSDGRIRPVFNGGSFNGWGGAAVRLGAGITVNPTTNSTGNTFPIGALEGDGTLGGGSAGSPVYTVGGLGLDTVFPGALTGNARLVKTGAGRLTLSGTSTHSGATDVIAGALEINGAFGSSIVTVASGAVLNGSGTAAGSLRVEAGGIVAPGSGNGEDAGTLQVGSLEMDAPTLRMDLSGAPAGANDRISVTGGGAITLSGAHTFAFHLTQGVLGNGTYNLIDTTGPLTASAASFISDLPANTRQTFTLEHSTSGVAPGYVRLVATGTGANLTWTGAGGGVWDLINTAAWTGATPGVFYNLDTVNFTDTASTGAVNITRPVAPLSLNVVNTAARAYTMAGSPVTGTGVLVKSGAGTLTLNLPSYDLPAATTDGAATVTVASTTNLRAGMAVRGPGIPENVTITTIVNATTLTLSQAATATDTAAALNFRTENTYAGGTILNAGEIILASNATPTADATTPPPANSHGLGTGPVTLNGGTLTLHGHTGAAFLAGALPNDLIVPAGKTATLRSTQGGLASAPSAGLGGGLSGSGTLNLVVNSVRGGITGDWSPFTGGIVAMRPASGAVDPRFQLANPAGLPLAAVQLEQVTLEYVGDTGEDGVVLPVGSLAGIATASISGSRSGSAPVIWQVGGRNTSTTYAGGFSPHASGGPIGLAKVGAGTWTLTGSGTVDAGVTIEQGLLVYGDAATDLLSGTNAARVHAGGTLQLNAGASVRFAAMDVASGGTLRGQGIVDSGLSSGGRVEAVGGVLSIEGDAFLGGDVAFASLTDRVAVNGALYLSGRILPPATGLSTGRRLLMTCTGDFNAAGATLGPLAPGFLGLLDTGTPGEVAVVIFDEAPYSAWALLRLGSSSAPGTSPGDDPDLDGMNNYEEYLAGTLPDDPLSNTPLTWGGAGANPWDQGVTATWRDGADLRVFRNNRRVAFDDSGVSTPAVDLRDAVRPGAVTINTATKSYTIDGAGSIDGPTGLVKSGAARLTLATANGYEGVTQVNSGIVTVGHDLALGAAATGTVVALNARLELQGGVTVVDEPLTISGPGGASFFTGALNSRTGVNTWAGPVTLGAHLTRVGAQNGATLVVAGPVGSGTNPYGLVVRNDTTGVTILSGASTYLGPTQIFIGTTRLAGGANRLPVGTALTIGSGTNAGLLDLNGCHQEVSTLTAGDASGVHLITNTAPGTADLTVNPAAASTYAGRLSGALRLVKRGGATLTLSGACTNAGGVWIRQGTLANTGSCTGPVTVDAGAVYTGGGVLNGNVDNAGLVMLHGGTMTITGDVHNNGTFRLTGGALLTVTGRFTNPGTLDLITAAQTLPADFDNTGVVLLATGVGIREARRTTDGSFAIEIQTHAGHNYTLSRSPGLSPAVWTPVSGQTVAGDGTVKTLVDVSSISAGSGCYRIVVDP